MYMFNPIDYWWMPHCMLKHLTGLSCPGCGMQRFLHAAMHGRVAEAVSYNYLLLLLIPYAVLLGAERTVLTGRARQRLKAVVEGRAAITLCCVTAVAWFVVRNILNI